MTHDIGIQEIAQDGLDMANQAMTDTTTKGRKAWRQAMRTLAKWVIERAPAGLRVVPERDETDDQKEFWCLRVPGGGTIAWNGKPWVPGQNSARFQTEIDARCFADACGLRLSVGAKELSEGR